MDKRYTRDPIILEKKEKAFTVVLYLFALMSAVSITLGFLNFLRMGPHHDQFFKLAFNTFLAFGGVVISKEILDSLARAVVPEWVYEEIKFDEGDIIKSKEEVEEWQAEEYEVLKVGRQNYLVKDLNSKEEKTLSFSEQNNYLKRVNIKRI